MSKKLMQLMLNNQNRPKDFKIEANGSEATIYVYDVIDSWFGVEPEAFARALNDISATTIHLRINSPGGDVFDGRAIATAIRQHSAKVIAHIDGLAASAATTVALAADEIFMADGAQFMIHNAWSYMSGNADELRKTAELLDRIDDGLVKDYVARTGLDESQIREWMAEETWFSAEEAVKYGFANAVSDAAAKKNTWNLSGYKNAPKVNEPDEPKFDKAKIERRLSLIECRA